MIERFDLEKAVKIVGLNIRAECVDEGRDFDVACRMIILAIEELKQYRTIGTVEQLNALQQDYWKLNEMCKEYSAVGTIEEFRELKYPDLLRCEDGTYAHVGDVVFARIWGPNSCKGIRGELIEIGFCEPDHTLYFSIEADDHVYTYVLDNRNQFEIKMITRNINILQSEKDTHYENEKNADFEM